MDLFRATEAAFPNTQMKRPTRTIDVNSNAPVQTMSADIPPSSGSFTFPLESAFADRFIVWRALGSMLFLEERSICHTIQDGCISFNFARSPILPGTCISFTNDVLSLVVPTQSSVHRFYSRLGSDSAQMDGEMAESTLAQFVDALRAQDGGPRHDSHDVHLISTRGVPTRAAVASRSGETRIAVVVGDGQLVVVNMPNNSSDASDEIVVKEGGLLTRFMGQTVPRVLDVAASGLSRARSTLGGSLDFTAFYTINVDGSVRVVNGETCQVTCIMSMEDIFSSLPKADEMLDASIHWAICDGMELIVVALTMDKHIHYVVLRDVERQLFAVAEAMAPKHARLVDFGIQSMPFSDGGIIRLWTVTGGRSTGSTYALEYVDLPLPGATAGALPPEAAMLNWQRVRPIEEKELDEDVDAAIEGGTLDRLRRLVFNVERHSFDVLLRAVKVTCESDDRSMLRCTSDDWNALVSHADTFTRSPEFERKFGGPRRGSREGHEETECRFLRELESTCAQIERSLRAPLGLFMTSINGVAMVGVILEKRLTVVLDPCKPLISQLSTSERDTLAAALDAVNKDEENSDMLSSDSDEEQSPRRRYGGATSSRGRRGGRSSLRMAEDEEDEESTRDLNHAITVFLREASAVSEEEEEEKMNTTNDDTSNTGSRDSDDGGSMQMDDENGGYSESTQSNSSGETSDFARHYYGGTFTSGLVSALLRLRVRDGLVLCTGMIKIAAQKRKLEAHVSLLRNFERSLRLLNTQLTACMEREAGGFESLAGWLFSPSRLRILRVEGGEEGGQLGEDPPLFYDYVDRSVLASLCALNPLSTCQALPKILAANEKYETLKMILALWTPTTLPKRLRAVVAYFRGIALSGTGLPRKAVTELMEAAGGMRRGDVGVQQALRPLGSGPSGNLPRMRIQEEKLGVGDYFVKVIRLLNEHGHQQEVIELSREAMGSLPDGEHLASINATLFKRQVDGEQWAEALSTITSTKDTSLQRTFVHDLIARLLSVGDWQTIIKADFGQMTRTVECILVNGARGTDISVQPHPFELCSAFHINKNNFYEAAHMQYELACCLRSAVQSKEIFKRRKDALTATVNLLDLLSAHKRFIAFPMAERVSTERNQRMCTMKGEDITREWLITRGRYALLEVVEGSVPPDDPYTLVMSLSRVNLFDTALELARHLDVDPSKILYTATTAALKIDANPQPLLPEWVAGNKQHAMSGVKHEHWSVVRGLLSSSMTRWPADPRPLKATTSAFLAHSVPVACWLHELCMEHDTETYCRLLLDYDEIPSALSVIAQVYAKAAAKITSAQARVVLPHLHAEEALKLAREAKNPEWKMMIDKCQEAMKTCSTRSSRFMFASNAAR